MPNPRSTHGRCVRDETDARPFLDQLPSYVVGLSAKRDEPDAWHLAQSETSDEVTFRFGALRKPYALTMGTITVDTLNVLVVGSGSIGVNVSLDGVSFPLPVEPATSVSPTSLSAWPGSPSGLQHAEIEATAVAWPSELVVTLTGATADDLDDLIVVLQLTVT